jgi:hypothetical protein
MIGHEHKISRDDAAAWTQTKGHLPPLRTEVYERKIPEEIRFEEIRKEQRILMALQRLDKLNLFHPVA